MDEAANIFKRYDADRQRMAAMLEAAGRINGRMKARGRRHLERGLLTVCDGHDETGNPVMRQAQADKLGETGGYLGRRAWNIRQCGRSAVGVGLLRGADLAGMPGEKVYHATCKDRLCPICNAKSAAHGAAALKQLIRAELDAGQRLLFGTLTVSHKLTDSLRSTRRVLDRAWARLIRRKWFRETFGERLRCAEVEFTKDNGWHPHFHLLLRLDSNCKAWHWPREKVMRELQRLWRESTSREGRPSWQIDLRELVVHRRCPETNVVLDVRYWLKPEERPRYERLAKSGRVRLHRQGPALSRVQSIDAVVEELTKYVTKRSGDGLKPNQVPLWNWTPEQLHEYALGIRYWNLRRASKGWEQLLIEFNEDEQLAREIEADQAGGYEYFPWAAIIEECRLAAFHGLSKDRADQFARDYPRILSALDREGCDISADMIRGWILRFFGCPDEPLQKLSVAPWMKRLHLDDKLCRRLDTPEWQQLKARHWRILLRMRRRMDRGDDVVRLGGLGMSKRRLRECCDDLSRESLIERDGPAWRLSERGRRLMTAGVKRLDRRERHNERKALRTARQLGLPFNTALAIDDDPV